MALGDLSPVTWRLDVYELKPDSPTEGVITDLSNLYTSDLTITKQRNYPDEIKFTLDLQQLEERAKALNLASKEILEPYKHKICCFRNNEFVAQGIVVKVSANLNNQSKNTLEVQCVDTLGLLEKRLIHQDYGEGSWADFAKEVIYDAQHEPNRIYNYAWEGDGISIDNAWFRGWKYTPGEQTLRNFPEWEPNHLYSMYDTCTHDAKFWEAKEHAFYSGETFSESNWTLLGILDSETGDVAGAYGVWREDDEEPGPTGTALGGWGGTSSCHMTANSFSVNNGGSISAISMADSTISTSLVAPYKGNPSEPLLPREYRQVEYIESTAGMSSMAEIGPYIDTGINLRDYGSRLKITMSFHLNSSINTTIWHTLCGTSYGRVDSNTWSWTPQFHFACNSSGKFVFEYATSNNTSSTSGVVTGPNLSTTPTVLTVDAIGDLPKMYGDTYIDPTIYNGNTTRTSGSKYGPNANLTLFARNYVNPNTSGEQRRGCYATPMKLYSCTIESEHFVVRNFIPCYRVSDNAYGLYDTINGKFYSNASTAGTFTGPSYIGPEPSADPDYIHTKAMVRDTNTGYEIYHVYNALGPLINKFYPEPFIAMLRRKQPDIIDSGDFVHQVEASGTPNDISIILHTMNGIERTILEGDMDDPDFRYDAAIWGVELTNLIEIIFDKNSSAASGSMDPAYVASHRYASMPPCTFTPPSGKTLNHWNTKPDDSGTSYYDFLDGDPNVTTLYAIWGNSPSS